MQGTYLNALTWRVRASFIRFGKDTSVHLYSNPLVYPKLSFFQEFEDKRFEQHWSAKGLLNELLKINLGKFFDLLSSWYIEYRSNQPVPVPSRFYSSFQRNVKLKEAQYREILRDRDEGACLSLPRSGVIDIGDDLDACKAENAAITRELAKEVKHALDSATTGEYSDNIYRLLVNACSLCINSIYLDEIPDAYLPSKIFSAWALECGNIISVAMPALELLCDHNTPDSIASNLVNNIETIFDLNSSPARILGRKHAIPHHSLMLKVPETKVDIYDTYYLGHRSDSQLAVDIHELALASLGNIIINCLDLSEKLKDSSYHDDLGSHISLFVKFLSDGKFAVNVAKQIINFGQRTAVKCAEHAISGPLVQNLTDLDGLALYLSNRKAYAQVEQSRSIETSLSPVQFLAYEDKYLVVDIKDSDEVQKALYYQHLIDKSHSLIHSILPKSFPAFYAHLLCEVLRSGSLPAKCNACNKPFFPTGNNSKYCSGYNNETGMYCNPARNTKLKLGKKPPHATAVNLRRKADTASGKDGHNPMAINKKRQLYFQELADAVDHTFGPFYQRSSLVPKALYEKWLKAINRPKNQPSTQTPEACGYPRPVIWNDSLADGNEVVFVTTQSAQLGTLPELLDKLAERNTSNCRKSDNGWAISKFDLVATVLSLELEADKTRKKGMEPIGHVPVPGLSNYWDCLPPRDNRIATAKAAIKEELGGEGHSQ